jgi:mannose-6-phosphate isomerase-like protein (cupin superfamily)
MKIVSLDTLPKTTTAHDAAGSKQQMIRDGEIPGLRQFAQVRFKPGEVAALHKHDDFYEVFFIESGEGAVTLNEKKHPIHPGMCITVEPGEFHEIENSGTTSLVITYFAIYTK